MSLCASMVCCKETQADLDICGSCSTLNVPTSSDELKAVHSVIQTNGYYGHSENLLVAMATEDYKDIRRINFIWYFINLNSA